MILKDSTGRFRFDITGSGNYFKNCRDFSTSFFHVCSYTKERSECAVASCKIGCAWHHGTDSARSPRRGGHGESEGARQGCAGLVRFFFESLQCRSG